MLRYRYKSTGERGESKMTTLVINLFKAQNTASAEAHKSIHTLVETARVVGYTNQSNEYSVTITWPFVGPAEEKYELLVSRGVPKSCLKLKK